MKKAGVIAASAAVTVMASSSSAVNSSTPSSSKEGSESCGGPGSRKGAEKKFAPRFDGLRFIETLVTAHR